ncbi:hypothetical protein CEK26_002066 [Fusarium fujikuroi]|uniref:Uncharacterized protein n=1 Tax=Fusarium fujikuroi TaxID=5127 RepID=A0A5Q3DS99_FUSFU|nr:hypothetical protein CEK27_002062 [Fusarium fujikuroi]QGI87078.1 hypothetical protein CEK25_002034 [Fusarium fujikuroi]QGJ00622.1 hypothetical protein CEK26_002066 [Fusarium fujikuroi]VTT64686.1 unnamed protein product [Fusarium fujikuroi]VTT78237.1 unnamed protein product [Fusarium fujikuroi]
MASVTIDLPQTKIPALSQRGARLIRASQRDPSSESTSETYAFINHGSSSATVSHGVNHDATTPPMPRLDVTESDTYARPLETPSPYQTRRALNDRVMPDTLPHFLPAWSTDNVCCQYLLHLPSLLLTRASLTISMRKCTDGSRVIGATGSFQQHNELLYDPVVRPEWARAQCGQAILLQVKRIFSHIDPSIPDLEHAPHRYHRHNRLGRMHLRQPSNPESSATLSANSLMLWLRYAANVHPTVTAIQQTRAFALTGLVLL